MEYDTKTQNQLIKQYYKQSTLTQLWTSRHIANQSSLKMASARSATQSPGNIRVLGL